MTQEKIHPCRDMILTEVLNFGKSKGGLHLPRSQDNEGPPRCRVLAVGPGSITIGADGSQGRVTPRVKVGDIVYVDGAQGYNVSRGVGLVPESAILAIIENAAEVMDVPALEGDEPKVTIQ